MPAGNKVFQCVEFLPHRVEGENNSLKIYNYIKSNNLKDYK